jgi:hypothetical protein
MSQNITNKIAGPREGDNSEKRIKIESALTVSGVLLFGLSGAALLGLIMISYAKSDAGVPDGLNFNDNGAVINYYLASYSKQLLLLLTALIAALIGYGLLRAAGTATKDTIPPKDYKLIEKMLLENRQEGINNYIKLSSLSGMIGAFTKLGLPGLPLATIALTLFFALLALAVQNADLSRSLFDLAKLTLGAFIGSYVQRSSSELQRLVVEAQGSPADGKRSPAETPDKTLSEQPDVSSASSAPAASLAEDLPAAEPVPFIDRAE